MQEPLLPQEGAPLLVLDAKHQQVQRQMQAAEVAQAEDTPAYATLQAYGLLDTSYRKEHFRDVFQDDDLTANSSKENTWRKRLKWGVVWTPGCGYMIYVSLLYCCVCLFI